jgi:tetratricopeptide (TPR) repeat protein
VAAFFALFPQLRPDWMQLEGGGRFGGFRRGLPTRQTSWTSPQPGRKTPALTTANAAFDKGMWNIERKEWDDAIKQFDEVLRLEPTNAQAQPDEALTDFDAVLRLKPKDINALLARAEINVFQHRPKSAIVDVDAALRLDPGNSNAFCLRGKIHEEEREYKLALDDYEYAVRRKSDNAIALNYLAWLLATAPDAALRDGQRAVTAALRAVALEEAKEWYTIDTLAAAFAETGKFAAAVHSQQESIRLAPLDEQDDLKSRLELYQAHKPYRLPAKTN